MALCQNCDETRIEYVGNGVQTDYTFPFEYNKKEDISVAYWTESEDGGSWAEVGSSAWVWKNETTIRFDIAPESGQKLAIYRCTDIDPLPAEFYPGTAIKAQDLNDNFFVLKNAVEEARCGFGNTGSGGGGGGDPTNTIKYDQQVNGEADALLSDSYIFTASASAARHDSYVQDDKPADLVYEQEGKVWHDTDAAKSYFWDSDQGVWVTWGGGGSPGPEGPAGPAGSVIVGDTPPTFYPESGSIQPRPLKNGDLWFDSYQVLLYMWYVDITGGQWVAVSTPGPKGDPGSGDGGGGFSGDYNDLTNKPTIGDGVITINQNGILRGSFSVNQLSPSIINLDLNDFSGDYDDLTNKPTIGDGLITINQGGVEKGTFTVNQDGPTVIDLDAGGGGPVDGFVKLDDEGQAQSITGGGGLNIQFGTAGAQLGNIAPLNDWSVYPART